MPPRYAYWTIIVDGKPTAFRAHEQEELLPTLKQLQSRHPDAVMKWFARGRLWNSREEEREAATRRVHTPHPRGPGWRPGGRHEDPRERFKIPRDEKRRRFAEKLHRERREETPPGDEREPKPGPPRERRPWTPKPPGSFRPREGQSSGSRPQGTFGRRVPGRGPGSSGPGRGPASSGRGPGSSAPGRGPGSGGPGGRPPRGHRPGSRGDRRKPGGSKGGGGSSR